MEEETTKYECDHEVGIQEFQINVDEESSYNSNLQQMEWTPSQESKLPTIGNT